jgi:glycosyltransferase involved in cell wall biosynthesis
MEQPDVSVILCTHNPRDDYLGRVLIGLRSQTLSFQHWEFLLIDNASNEPLADRFDLDWHPNGRHIREDELGLTQARLRGSSEAVAELLLFVDDDNVLDPDEFPIYPQAVAKLFGHTWCNLAVCRLSRSTV